MVARRRASAFQLQPCLQGSRLSKVKRLNAELAAVHKAGAQAAQALQRAQTENAELQEQLQCGAQELSDLAAVKDAR